MENTTPRYVPGAVEDDPWATLAAPDVPPLPIPGDVVKPVVPWAPPPAVVIAEVPVVVEQAPVEQAPVEQAPVESVVVPEEPAVVPTAVTATSVAPEVFTTPEPVPTTDVASLPQASFPPGVAAKLAIYVYLLTDARSGRPFFVGRGRGDRCFRHVDAARALGSSSDVTGATSAKPGKYPLLDRIREAESDGRPVRIEILRHGLTVDEADLVVAAVDDTLGLGLGSSLGSHRAPAVELGAGLAKRAKFKRSHQVVLLRVGAHGSDTTYDSARHGWRIGRRWVDLDSVRSPQWAVVVAGDLVESVYRIDDWEPAPLAGGTAGPYTVSGTRASDLEERYVGRSVSGYLGAGTPTQVTYVWCGPHWVNTAH